MPQFQRLSLQVFVVLFALFTVAIVSVQESNSNWLYEWVWVLTVTWEVLNFAVIAAVCTLWRPTRSSGMLSYSKQLPTSEEQANAENDEENSQPGSVRGNANSSNGGTNGSAGEGIELGNAAAGAGRHSFSILGVRCACMQALVCSLHES
jgi:hypothetical protein